jgi:hypothetical protein
MDELSSGIINSEKTKQKQTWNWNVLSASVWDYSGMNLKKQNRFSVLNWWEWDYNASVASFL